MGIGSMDWFSLFLWTVPRINVSRFSSANSPGLQVADYVAGAVQRYYEFGDAEYYDMIKDSILIEKRYYF